jgi:uncharacterized Zn finger protein
VKEKADHYLIGGNLQVQAANSEMAIIKVQGSAAKPYTVIFTADWDCDCPAHVECAHIVAAKLISPLRKKEQFSLPNTDEKLTEFLDRYL